MPVIEAPFYDQCPGFEGAFVPTGTFVLVRIDPVASVAVLEDEEATRSAAALGTCGWVLGVVTGILGGMLLDPSSKKINMSLQLALFGQGPPSDKPIASLPMSPAPQLYDDRPPIELNARLPWSNIYAHTKYSTSLIISRIHHGSAKIEATLTKAQHKEVCLRGMKDVTNWHNLPPVTVPEKLVDPVYVDPTVPEPSVGSGDEDSDEDDDSFLSQEMEDMGVKIAKLRIYGEICVDPTMYSEPLGAPCEFLEPVRRIRQLWDNWEARRTTEILAKRPRTTAWAQGVTNAHSVNDSGSESDNVAPRTPPMDDDIMPEDAIDDRIERDRLARIANRAAPPPPLAGEDAPTPIAIPSPAISSLVAPISGLSTASIEVALNVVTPAGDKDAPGSLVFRTPGTATNVGDGEILPCSAKAASPCALEADASTDEHREEGSPAVDTPSFVGAKLVGLIKRVRTASSIIARLTRRFSPVNAKERPRNAE